MFKNIEIAAFNLQSALLAAKHKVNRIEFCADYSLGGITPDIDDFIALKKIYNNPIFIMIRPRGGDFIYNSKELEKMENSIKEFINLGADGFVFGVLNTDNEVDIENNKRLISLTNGLPTTFHRAFDRAINLVKALEDIIDCGFDNILSSGRENCVLDGVELLNQLKIRANNRIKFVAGGGVRSSNLKAISQSFDTDFYHSSAILNASGIADENEIIALMNNLKSC